MRMRTGRLEEFETFAIWESGGLTSPMTSPLLPDWRFSTLHQTPCPIFNRRSSRLVSVSDSDRGRDRDGWVKNERESVWRVDTRAALDCSKEKSWGLVSSRERWQHAEPELTILIWAYTALTNRWISRSGTPMDKRSLKPSRMSRHSNSDPPSPCSGFDGGCDRSCACVWRCGRRVSYTCFRVGRPSLSEVASPVPRESEGNILGELALVEEDEMQAGKEEGVMWMNAGEVGDGSGVPCTF